MYLPCVIFIIMVILGDAFDIFNESDSLISVNDLPIPAILEGYKTSLKEFPFAARLYINPISTKVMPLKHTCTVETIHPKFVITAANCIVSDANMIVVTGEADQEDFKKGIQLEKYKQYKVETSFVHPLFNPVTYKHDLALLELENPMNHDDFGVVPISYERLKTLSKAQIFGWGATSGNPFNNALFAKNLTVETCTKQTVEDYEFICLREPGIKTGDTGGALIIDGKLMGIASHIQSTLRTKVITNYYYTAMWEEKEFVELIIDKNGASSTESFLFLTMATVTFIKWKTQKL